MLQAKKRRWKNSSLKTNSILCFLFFSMGQRRHTLPGLCCVEKISARWGHLNGTKMILRDRESQQSTQEIKLLCVLEAIRQKWNCFEIWELELESSCWRRTWIPFSFSLLYIYLCPFFFLFEISIKFYQKIITEVYLCKETMYLNA